MHTLRWTLIGVCLLALCVPAGAQTNRDDVTTTQPDEPVIPTAPVIGYIPANAMGFLMINNLQEFSDNFTSFLTAIDDSLMPPGGLMMTAQMMLDIGPGFDPNGGLAVVLLDPEPFGVDLFEDLFGYEDEEFEYEVYYDDEDFVDGDDVPVDEEFVEEELVEDLVDDTWPVVFFVPGDSIEGVFGNYPMIVDEEAGFTVIDLDSQAVFAVAQEGYVVLSPRADALAAVLAETDMLVDQMTPDEVAALTSPDISLHVNMVTAGPLLQGKMQEFLTLWESDSEEFDPDDPDQADERPRSNMADGMAAAFSVYDYLLEGAEGATLGMSANETGMALDVTLAYDPESLMGRALLSQPIQPFRLPDRVPDLSYVAAGGVNVFYTEEMIEAFRPLGPRMLEAMGLTGDLPADAMEQIQRITDEMYPKIKGFQFVFGPDPMGTGAFASAVLVECSDLQRVQVLFQELLVEEQAILDAMAAAEGDAEATTLVYEEDALTINGISVDRLDVVEPASDEPPTDDELAARAIMGDQVSFLIAPLEDRSVIVVTMGGDQDTMAQALDTAMEGGPIMTQADVAEAMMIVPEDACMVALLNLRNTGLFIESLTSALEEDDSGDPADDNPFKYMVTNAPIVMFARVYESSASGTVFLPIQALKEAIESSQRVIEEQLDRMDDVYKDDTDF